MEKICIYNEKGGVGKTTIGLLLAGYLAYCKGKRVCVLDFDYPTYHFSEVRRSEERFLRDPRSPLSVWMRDNAPALPPYDICRVPTNKAGVYTPAAVFPFVSGLRGSGADYLLYDFPGRFTQDEPMSFLAANGFIDKVVIPMDTDMQSRRSALFIADAMQRNGIACTAFWNRVSVFERSGTGERFRRGAEPFIQRGLTVMDEVVRDIRKFSRDSDEHLFIRSTMCFPERYIRQWAPSLFPFLESLTAFIDNNKK